MRMSQNRGGLHLFSGFDRILAKTGVPALNATNPKGSQRGSLYRDLSSPVEHLSDMLGRANTQRGFQTGRCSVRWLR